MLLKNIIIVGFGGMLGTIMRYLVAIFIKQANFPYATLTVNILGCLLMGIFMGITLRTEVPNSGRLFLVTGICGGFTTFSAFAWENFQLLQQGRYGGFILYMAGSVIVGILAVAAGYYFSK